MRWGIIGLRYRDREEIIKWLTLAANTGHAEAQYELAEIYEMGDNNEYGHGPIIPKNDELARHYYKLAADQGHPNANQELERMHKEAARESSVAPISSSSSSSSLAPSTNPQPSAPPRALLNPNEVSLFDNDTPVDYTSYSNSSSSSVLASTPISSSSSGSSSQSKSSKVSTPTLSSSPSLSTILVKHAFSLMRKDGNSGIDTTPQETERLFKLICAEATQGNADAQFYLGNMYEHGLDGSPRNSIRALKYYKQAADQRHAKAQTALNRINQQLDLNTPSASETSKLSTSSSSVSSSSSSSSSVPSVVSQSSFFPPSDWYSVKEDPDDIFIQGYKHLKADRFDSAKKCFEAAAKEKHSEACYYLAKMYADKKIQTKDDRERQLYIQYWYSEAESLGHKGAAYRMGKIHANSEYRYGDLHVDGKDISFGPKNARESFNWYQRAGIEHAKAQYELGLHYEKEYNETNLFICAEVSYDYFQNAVNLGSQKAYAALSRLNAPLIKKLQEYVDNKMIENRSGFLSPSRDDVTRVALTLIIIRKLAGAKRKIKFSPEELALIPSSKRLNAIFSEPEHSWVADKLNGEWALQPQAQSPFASRMGMSNGR